jgi:hypothetical protein
LVRHRQDRQKECLTIEKKKREKKKKKRRGAVAAAKTKKQQNKIFHFLIFDLGKKMKNLDIIKLVCFFENDVGCLSLAKLL